MKNKVEPAEPELQAGYSDLEIILALILCALVSGALGVLIGIYLRL